MATCMEISKGLQKSPDLGLFFPFFGREGYLKKKTFLGGVLFFLNLFISDSEEDWIAMFSIFTSFSPITLIFFSLPFYASIPISELVKV